MHADRGRHRIIVSVEHEQPSFGLDGADHFRKPRPQRSVEIVRRHRSADESADVLHGDIIQATSTASLSGRSP